MRFWFSRLWLIVRVGPPSKVREIEDLRLCYAIASVFCLLDRGEDEKSVVEGDSEKDLPVSSIYTCHRSPTVSYDYCSAIAEDVAGEVGRGMSRIAPHELHEKWWCVNVRR